MEQTRIEEALGLLYKNWWSRKNRKQAFEVLGAIFNSDQLGMIRRGVESRLKKDELKVYAKPEFTSQQMEWILHFFTGHGQSRTILSVEKVAVFAKPEFQWQQMMVIGDALCLYPIDKVSYLAKTDFDYRQMNVICEGIACELTDAQLAFFARPERTYSEMKFILDAFEHNLTLEQVEIVMNPVFDRMQRDQIQLGFENGLSVEQVSAYADSALSAWEMNQIRKALEQGATKEQLEDFLASDFNTTFPSNAEPVYYSGPISTVEEVKKEHILERSFLQLKSKLSSGLFSF